MSFHYKIFNLIFQIVYMNDKNGTKFAYFPHPKYNPATRENDICVIKLAEEFDTAARYYFLAYFGHSTKRSTKWLVEKVEILVDQYFPIEILMLMVCLKQNKLVLQNTI